MEINRGTQKKIVSERIRNRRGNHPNEIILSEEMAEIYFNHFEPPTDEEAEIIVIKGYR